jgi:glycosyltransferase involved in cell wall biosynthesis
VKVCFVVSSPLTVRAFLAAHIARLAKEFDVTVIANADRLPIEGARFIPAPIERPISPLRDLRALAKLVGIFRRERFDLVHSVTPKAGLLAMLAARLAGVPARLHTFTGQVWATRTGFARSFLRRMDRLIAASATHVLVDSRSQRDFLIAQGVVGAKKSAVLANGSICGVDGDRFRPRAAMKAAGEVVFLFVGRLAKDKGVLDLIDAFSRLGNPLARLVLVGPDEERLARSLERVTWVGGTDRVEDYMAAADVFCLPSYREGFGQVAIEASACGLPVIASRIYGLTDAVADGETGLLHAPGDVAALARHMATLLAQPELRRRMGDAGRERALRDFSTERVSQALLDFYRGIADGR